MHCSYALQSYMYHFENIKHISYTFFIDKNTSNSLIFEGINANTQNKGFN